MKKISLTVLGFFLLAVALPVGAATLSSAPATVNVVVGQTFNLPVTVDTQGAKAVTVKSQISYSEGMLEAVSWNFGSGWTQLSQPGYDQLGSGTIIKTAGFPTGFIGTKVLGTVTFRALTSGQATVSFTTGSFALNDQNQSLPLTSSGTSVIVSAVASVPGQTQATQNTPASNTGGATTPASNTANNTNNTPGSETPGTDSADQTANVVDALGENATSTDDLAAVGAVAGVWERLQSNWWWIVLLLAVLGGTWWYTRTPKSEI